MHCYLPFLQVRFDVFKLEAVILHEYEYIGLKRDRLNWSANLDNSQTFGLWVKIPVAAPE